MVQRGIDFDALKNVYNIEDEAPYFRDMEHMPLAPHRAHLPRADEYYWWFHRTVTSMSDFVSFVVDESTQAKMDHDFYLGNDRNRTAKEGNLIPDEQKVKFVKGKTYDRSTVRQYLYEYYVARASWSRHDPKMRTDGARFWFFAKGIKDYIILSGK